MYSTFSCHCQFFGIMTQWIIKWNQFSLFRYPDLCLILLFSSIFNFLPKKMMDWVISQLIDVVQWTFWCFETQNLCMSHNCERSFLKSVTFTLITFCILVGPLCCTTVGEAETRNGLKCESLVQIGKKRWQAKPTSTGIPELTLTVWFRLDQWFILH